ncbi:MAG: 5'-nucleotidase C-terminal domain-containing protein [Lachnospiraceae bacterium]|nr:5'-nucleotidase C-terminal domain-containing protein [Lachnospiraceae bacterium]
MKSWKKRLFTTVLVCALFAEAVTGQMASFLKSIETEAAQKEEIDLKSQNTQHIRTTGFSEVTFEPDSFSKEQQTKNHLGDFIADAFLWKTKADAAIVRTNDIQNGIAKGKVTHDDLKTLVGDSQSVCVLNVKGKQILKALESGIYENENLLQTAGITYEIREQQDGNCKIRNVKIDGRDLDEKKNYKIAGMKKTFFQRQDGIFEDAFVTAGKDLADADDTLYQYLMEELGGNLTQKKYGLEARKRIQFLSKETKTQVTMLEEKKKIYQDDEYQLCARVDTKSSEVGVRWSSSDSRIAAVTKTGKIVGISPGRAIVTAWAEDGSGANARCVVTVVGKYQIIYECNGGENSPANPEVYIGETVVELKNPTKENAEFLGWYYDEACTRLAKNISQQDVTVYAAWKEITEKK